MKEWFKARNFWGASLAALSDEDAGRLAKAIWQYTMTGTAPEVSGGIAGIFAMIRFQLEQDDAATQAISDVRSAAGKKGGRPPREAPDPGEATEANANFAFDEKAKKPIALFALSDKAKEANEAIADNKNKNKNKNKSKNYILDDDDDDDDDRRARADAAEAINRAFVTHFGRAPTPAEAETLITKAVMLETPPSLIAEAIRIAAANGAKSPAPYAGKLFREWASEEIETVEELEEYRFLKDAGAGRNEYGSTDIDARMEAARKDRMEKHTREAGS